MQITLVFTFQTSGGVRVVCEYCPIHQRTPFFLTTCETPGASPPHAARASNSGARHLARSDLRQTREMRHAAGRKKVARPGWPPSGPPSDAPRARGFFLLPAAGRVVGVLDAARGAPRR